MTRGSRGRSQWRLFRWELTRLDISEAVGLLVCTFYIFLLFLCHLANELRLPPIRSFQLNLYSESIRRFFFISK